MINSEKVKFKDILKNPGPVLVVFHANWCGICAAQAPNIEELKKELGDAIDVVRIDVDVRKKKAKQYNIRSLPTLIIFKDGNIVWRESGLKSKTQLLDITSDFIDASLKPAREEIEASTKRPTWFDMIFKNN